MDGVILKFENRSSIWLWCIVESDRGKIQEMINLKTLTVRTEKRARNAVPWLIWRENFSAVWKCYKIIFVNLENENDPFQKFPDTHSLYLMYEMRFWEPFGGKIMTKSRS